MGDAWVGVPVFEQLDNVVTLSVDQLGLPFGQMRTLLVFFITYVLAIIHRYLPTTSTRHAFTAVTGFLLALYWLGAPILHSVATAGIVYGVARFSKSTRTPAYMTVLLMVYLSASHIYRQLAANLEWRVDFSLPQMILTVRLSSFAFALADGRKPEKLLNPGDGALAIKKVPSVLEFYAFVFYFGAFFAGPYVNIREYLEFTDRSMFNDMKGRVPWPSARKVLLTSIIMFAAFGCAVAAHHRFNETWMLSDDFFGGNFAHRVVGVLLTAMFFRAKYYTAWKFAEITNLLSGLSYSGVEEIEGDDEKTGKPKKKRIMTFERCNNCVLWDVEFMPNIHTASVAWNTGVHRWLRRYVYMRLTPMGKKAGTMQTAGTTLVSAFWHGFYPGYYMFFGSLAFLIELNRLAHRQLPPRLIALGKRFGIPNLLMSIYHYAGIVLCVCLVDYISVPFMVMEFRGAMRVWRSLYYIGHFVIVPGFVIFAFLLPKPRQLPGKKKEH